MSDEQKPVIVVVDGQQRTFDRVALRHPKMLNFIAEPTPQRELTPLQKVAKERGYRHHFIYQPFLDQGREGACVGFGIAHALNAGPITRRPLLADDDAYRLFTLGRQRDEWAGEDYDGTSVNGGMLAAREFAYITRFEWSFDVERTIELLLLDGPIVMGVDWTEGMFSIDAEGFIAPTGRFAGGHCVALVGVNMNDRVVWGRNSWGRGWGRNGMFKLTFDDLATLHKGIRYPGDFALMEEVRTQRLRKIAA